MDFKKFVPKKHMRDFKHPLVTRRDFLAHGAIAFSALALPPLAPRALMKRMECGANPGATWIPFMTFDMAGGGSLPGNFLVGKRGGPEDLLPSYNILGWDPRAGGALNKDFGLPMAAKASTMLTGILQSASPEARAKLRMGSLCHRADFDTTSNPLNASTLVLRSGSRGLFVANGLGTNDSLSGGNSSGVDQGPLYKPVLVRSLDDILRSTTIGGPAFQGFQIEKMSAMAHGQIDLSSIQKLDYIPRPDGQALADATECAYGKTLDFLDGVQGLDPRSDTDAQSIYRIDQNSSPGTDNVITASLAMGTITGNSGPSTWTLGNCDYHTGSQDEGDRQDLAMGIQIGLAIELAHRKQKPFFFQLITDGGNTAAEGTRDWSADSGETGMSVIGYYNPNGAPKQLRLQVGNYTTSQGADASSMIGNSPRLAAYATLANYLNVSGRLGEFSILAPGVFADAGQLDSVLIFDGK